MKKAINFFQYATMAIGFIVIVIFLVPKFFGINPYIVISGSMEDAIKTGAVAYVDTNVLPQEIKVGDVIAFNIGSRQVTHRVIEIHDDNSFTTKGDANKVVDANRVKFSNYSGKTIFNIPYIGYVLAAIQTKLGYSILIMIVILNITTIFFFNDKKESKHSTIEITTKEEQKEE